MKEVQNKWNTLKLNDDIWAKLIYFERNRRLAKAYVSAPVLTVDGSTNGLDGFRIGLSGIDNTYRSLDSVGCLRSIGQGIKLKIDINGNILIRRISHKSANASSCQVWVKDWPSDSKNDSSSSVENCTMREIGRSDTSYKLFDMRKFRLQLEKRRLNSRISMDWRQCVTVISFVNSSPSNQIEQQQQPNNLLEDPCWLMIINIIAIDMLKSSICDEDSKLHPMLSMMKHPNSMNDDDDEQQPDRFNRRAIIDDAIRTCSSASMASVPCTMLNNNNNNTSSRLNRASSSTDATINLVAANERIKKLRTTNTRYKQLACLKQSNYANQRRYQSTQQLSSGSNSIYTTFDMKYLNNGKQSSNFDYNSSTTTSDYHSGSRGTSISHNYRAGRESDQLKQPVKASLESGSKSLSLSNFDLSKRRLDLKAMQTSIKMNYDFINEDHHHQLHHMYHRVDSGRSQLMSGDNRRAMQSIGNQSSNCCSMRDKHSDCNQEQQLSQCQTEVQEKEHKQKVSRSSIASSSSSSGCADNDYLMSHSSSSMSSSSASNERDLSSQPASSSGIICSGNTSDDYDDRRNLSVDAAAKGSASEQVDNNKSPLKEHDKLSVFNNQQQQQHKPRRGYKIKSTIPDGQCDCHHANAHNDNADPGNHLHQHCDCPPVAFDCDCCCDCFSCPAELEDPTGGCYCDDFDHNPAAQQAVDKCNKKNLPPRESRSRSNKQSLKSATEAFYDQSKVSTDERNQKSLTNSKYSSKQTSGWLEKSKYSKIIPKFIFFSSSDNQQARNKITQQANSQSNSDDK